MFLFYPNNLLHPTSKWDTRFPKKKDLFDDSDDPVTDVAAAFPTT
jgi:hypothetical protein